MDLITIWHPKYGIFYDIFDNFEEVKNEQEPKIDRRGGHTVRTSTGGIQLALFPV